MYFIHIAIHYTPNTMYIHVIDVIYKDHGMIINVTD
jgi:hypothetical protein